MKKFLIFTLYIGISLSTALFAQQTPLAKYAIIPDGYQHIYYQFVKNFVVRKLPSNQGTYFGQINDDGSLCGYAAYESSGGGTLIGQYYEGALLFGITLSTPTISVGSKDFYASYSATTGELLGIMKDEVMQNMLPADAKSYAFAQLTYDNGDRYVGELYKGQRHGYGVYYYKSGGYWYGQFKNNQRDGFGAMFTADGRLQVGQWKTK